MPDDQEDEAQPTAPLVTEIDRLRRRVAELEHGTELVALAERSFREVSDALPVVVFTATADGLVDFVNRAFTELTGVGVERLIDEGTAAWLSVVHPDDLAGVYQAWPRVAAYAFEARLYRVVDASYRWHLVRATPMHDERGRISRWYGTAVDIHETRVAEAREREKAELLERTHDAVFLQDTEGKLRYANRAAETLFGWTREEVLGRRLDEVPFDSSAVLEASREAWLHGSWRGDLAPSQDGRVLEGRWSALRRADGFVEGMLAFHTDVTEQRRIEQVLMRTQRMEIVGALAGGLAHDLNNVLTPIVCAVDLLRETEVSSERLTDLETISECATRGSEMVSQLLAFARGRESQSTDVDVETVIREVVRLVRDSLPKNIVWDLDLAGGGTVRGDAAQLRQLLLNLFINARDAMPDGGTLSVRIGRLHAEDRAPEASVAGEHVVIEVEDEGGGMPPDVLERIFEPFFTTKELGRGTGLGLATVHSVVKSHRGFVRVDSVLGRGTRFSICLPASTSSAPASTLVADESSLPRGRGEGVLLVDDDLAIRGVVSRALERFGYRVWTAEHGAAALEIYEAHRDEVDLVLTDGAMPVMDGISLVREIRARAPELPIVTASGLDAAEQLALGGVVSRHVVAKPYSIDMLLRVIRTALDERPR